MADIEAINRMKLCLLCRSSAEWPYTTLGASIHDKFGMHSTLGKTWAPMAKHEAYGLHMQMLKMLGLGV